MRQTAGGMTDTDKPDPDKPDPVRPRTPAPSPETLVPDTPGITAHPPLVFLGAIVLGFVLDAIWPAGLIEADIGAQSGYAMIAAALALMIWAMRTLRRAGTNIETYRPVITVVTDGPYRYSRNPIYLSALYGLAGLALAADNAWLLAMLLPVYLILCDRVIVREERYLAAKFGDDYLRYKASVRRWM